MCYIIVMEDEPGAAKRSVRIPLLLTPDEAEELDEWQFANRLRTRSSALREMMRRAIEAHKASPSVRSKASKP